MKHSRKGWCALASREWTRRRAVSLAALVFALCVSPAFSQVIINEIMYHPYEPWPTNQPAKTPNNSQYVEILNTGPGAVDLGDYRFDNGIDYQFQSGTVIAPGGYLLVCDNAAGFTNYYPTVTNYVGGFGGDLANGGERVTLSRFDGTNWVTVDTIEYVDGGPADGDGASLELINPGFARLRNQYFGDWAPSTFVRTNGFLPGTPAAEQQSGVPDGTPGRANSVYNPSPLPVVGDVMHDPPIPPANSMITIACRATGRDSDALQAVVLKYRKDAIPTNTWSQTNMVDTGVSGDVAAGDGVYTVRLPPYGQPGYQDGDLIEFTITATDVTGTRTFPATNSSGVLSGPYSYLCYIGEDAYSDCAYPGEYLTYHILMTKSNRQILESRDVYSDDTLDATLISDDGHVLYNSGVRYRGGSSRQGTRPYIPYRVDPPRGKTVDGFRELNFNANRAMGQFMGMAVMADAGYGCFASDVALARLWLNDTHLSAGVDHRIYVRLEAINDDFIARRYPSNEGNRYSNDGDVADGDLRWWANLSDYQQTNSTWSDGRGYFVETNNPYTVWHELTNFATVLHQDAALYPQILTNRMNVRQWARHYATMVCLDNREAGYGCPYNAYGDELRLYCDPADGQFDIYPWDFSDVIQSTEARVWQWTDNSAGVITKFLFNPPVLPYYAGDCLDVMDTAMSQSNMLAMIDGMGSKAVSYKSEWTSTIAGQRTQLRAKISTNLTVNVNGAPAGVGSTLVPATAVDTLYPVNDVNQQFNGWVYLGSYDFSASGSEYVRVKSDNESLLTTMADAVMFSNATATVIADNDDAAHFQVTGSWGTYTSGGYTNGSYRNSTAPDSTATWTPVLPGAGRYAVYAWCITPVGRFPPDPLADYTIVANQVHPLASFSGTAPQAYTARVRVNGTDAAWDLRNNAWTNGPVILPGKVNPVTVQALDSESRVLRSTNLLLIAYNTPQRKSGAIAANTVWNGSNGAILVESDVTVSSSATLTITGRTTVVFSPGAKIRVTSGTLDLRGSGEFPVYLFPSNATPWSVEASGSGSLITGQYAVASGGRFTADGGARIALQDSTLMFGPATNPIVSAVNADSVTLSRCIVSNYTKMAFDHTPILIEECLLANMSQCGVEVTNATGSAVLRRTTIADSIGSTPADGVRLLNSPIGLVTNCLFRNVSGTAALANSSAALVSRSLIYSCGSALSAQGGSALTNWNNTISACATGLQGATQAAANLIVWSNAVSVTNGPATVVYSDVEMPGANLYAGTGNLNRNPWFRSPAESDYRLLDISPCLHGAGDGNPMGASYPVGANPAAPSQLLLTNVLPAEAELRWQDNSPDETSFEIQRSTDGLTWQVVTNLSANATNCVDRGLVEDTVYFYRLRARHARGASLFSEVRSTSTLTAQTTQDLIDHLRITEIMYNPPGAGDPSEFIEIKNVGDHTLNLSGLTFDGNRFAFTNNTILGAGAFFVLVFNPAGFTNQYTGVPYQGVYQNGTGLDNGGETIWIKNSEGTDIFRLSYDDALPWPLTADGDGYSLVLVNENEIGPYDSARWRASTDIGGSPGSNDPTPPFGTIVINELLAHQDVEPPGDWIELFNAGSNAVNVGGWYLSDDESNLRRYQIPGGITIPAGGYRVFTESADFGTSAIGANGFALSELGETVYLSSASNGVMTSYRTYVKFGATENGVTMGRYTLSDGEEDFTAASAPTMGASNAYPKVGPVVINEIMYNPSAGGKEFVEIYNASGTTVSLYDVAHPTNTWRFDAAMEFIFPPGTALAPNEYALVVSIDPALFRSLFGLTNAALKIFGPFDGALANGGETVKLYKPNDPEPNGFAPYVLADRVQYKDQPPWPAAADNGGPSLERVDPAKYGNDPTNWVAATVGGTPCAPNNVSQQPSVAFQDPNGQGFESNRTINAVVSLWPVSASTVTVQYAVSGGTAIPETDFSCPGGTLVFWPYDAAKTIPLVVKDDGTPEPDETVEITLTQVSANARLGGNARYTYTIIDTDAVTLSAPLIQPSGTTLFTNLISVTISPTVPNSTIRYTTDGSRPSAADPVYLGPFSLSASARITARTFLGSYNAGDSASSLFLAQTPTNGYVPPPPATYWEGGVAGGTDDAEELEWRNAMALTNQAVTLGLTNTYVAAGFRFPGVAVPNGANVTNAYLQFTSAGDNSGSAALTVYAQAIDNAPTFAGTAANITSRALTTNFIAWAPAAWTTSERGYPERTPNLKGLVGEVMSRPGWTSNNAMAFIVRYGACPDTRAARAFESSPAQAATLRIEWATNAASQYWLGVMTNGNGTITGGNRWVPAGSNATAQATPAGYHHFTYWSGDVDGGNPNSPAITVLMDMNRTISAGFAENLTSCGAPEWWLAQYYQTNSFEAVAAEDTDGDGLSGCQEYIAGTVPTNTESVLKFRQVRNETNGAAVYWSSVTSRTYSVFRSADLMAEWPPQPLTSGVPGDSTGTNLFLEQPPPGVPAFYRVRVTKP